MRYLALVDGEHYPPVVEDALGELQTRPDIELVGAVLAGGREKLPAGGLDTLAGCSLRQGGDPRTLLDRALLELQPDVVVDLSDEPVLGYRRRFELASIALFRGVAYQGADFRFDPPPRPRLLDVPSIAVIGTGKRTGKTAIAGSAARLLKRSGRRPVVVAMGRGGPAQPELLHGERGQLDAATLLAVADAGKHAASDYIEDALFAHVPTVGCRRCGGGLAGGVEFSNVQAGARATAELDHDVVVLEGSGSAIPPVHADATILVAPSWLPEEHLVGYFGPYRLLLADLVVVTMCEDPFGSPSHISTIVSRVREAFRGSDGGEPRGEIQVVLTVFRPTPADTVSGASVVVVTTAPEAAGATIKQHLEQEHGCRVIGISHALSDRERLTAELQALQGGADVLLCEVKAAAVDIATRWALDRGLSVTYMDNVPQAIDGAEIDGALSSVVDLASARHRQG